MSLKMLTDYHVKELRKVEEPVDVFEQLLEESSYVQKQRAIGVAEGLREVLVDIMSARYPALAKLAQEYAARQNDVGAFRTTIQLLATASDEAHARSILGAAPAI